MLLKILVNIVMFYCTKMDLPNELLEWFLSAQATLVTKSENEVRQLIFNEEHYPAKAYKSGDLNLLN